MKKIHWGFPHMEPSTSRNKGLARQQSMRIQHILLVFAVVTRPSPAFLPLVQMLGTQFPKASIHNFHYPVN